MPLHRPFCATAVSFRYIVPRHTATFHTTAAWRHEPTSFYEILGLELNASTRDIKKYIHIHPHLLYQLIQFRQFYNLSKTHHPDRNPSDPTAAERFVKISEAYATLGSPHKRGRYDRSIQSSHPSPRQNPPGSHSSASTPFGSRPASGLSRRRTQFKGPPPSFYRNGGWGAHGSRRQSQAEGSSNPSRGRATGTSPGGGMGHGQDQAGFSNDVPHFDQDGHYRTQEQQDRRRIRRIREESVEFSEGGGMFLRFLMTSGVVLLAFSVPLLGAGPEPAERTREKVSNA